MEYNKDLDEEKIREYLCYLTAVIARTEFSQDNTRERNAHQSLEAKMAREIAAQALRGMSVGAFVQAPPQELCSNMITFYERQNSLMQNQHDTGAIEALRRLGAQIGVVNDSRLSSE